MSHDHPIQISTDHARSGVTGHGVRFVLAAGLALAVLAMIGAAFMV